MSYILCQVNFSFQVSQTILFDVSFTLVLWYVTLLYVCSTVTPYQFWPLSCSLLWINCFAFGITNYCRTIASRFIIWWMDEWWMMWWLYLIPNYYEGPDSNSIELNWREPDDSQAKVGRVNLSLLTLTAWCSWSRTPPIFPMVPILSIDPYPEAWLFIGIKFRHSRNFNNKNRASIATRQTQLQPSRWPSSTQVKTTRGTRSE
jgi:hypothetical protein